MLAALAALMIEAKENYEEYGQKQGNDAKSLLGKKKQSGSGQLAEAMEVPRIPQTTQSRPRWLATRRR